MENFKLEDVKNDFDKFSSEWVNTPEYNDFIYSEFLKKVNSIDFLSEHSNYIGLHKMGFGERPFNYLWMCLISQMPQEFKFLEIGIYKGSILCLAKLISDKMSKQAKIYGVSPLNTAGDKYSTYQEDNYLNCIGRLFEDFKLDLNETTIIKGYSTDPDIKNSVKEEGKFDIIYIDGSHNYNDVVSDIELCDEILNVNGFMVLDDASTHLKLGRLPGFWGHKDVGDAVRDKLESNNKYKHLFACGHNRVFKKLL
jgi:cephalosporin hydroxylase